MTQLWHYTCDHGHDAIGSVGYLVPLVELVDEGRVVPPWGQYVWMTDLSVPIRAALGLTSHMLNCDRTKHRYRVTGGPVAKWTHVRRDLLAADEREGLEAEPGARPANWWVSRGPVPVQYDPLTTE